MPSTLVALAVTVLAVLPCAAYTWAFERQASAYGVSFADRTPQLIATSLIFHLLLGWPEFLAYRLALAGQSVDASGFGAWWIVALVLMAVPASAGTVLGGLYATRVSRDGWNWLRARISDSQEARLLEACLGKTPAPRAWDDLFSDRPATYVRVRTASGDWLAGRFADGARPGSSMKPPAKLPTGARVASPRIDGPQAPKSR
ncbi:hypothetical protein BH10ACT10_BH10ACT10_27630 [soil metagenome]